MPNPYKDIFDNEENESQDKKVNAPFEQKSSLSFSALEDDGFEMNTEEPLDEILKDIKVFNEKADVFSKLLSKTRAVDHKVDNSITSLFFVANDPHDKRYLRGERNYHNTLIMKFEAIIVPMRELAELHLKTIKRFNNDIDENYFSIEKTDHAVKTEKELAVNGISLQRTILADAANSLEIFKDGLNQTEKRLKKYINAGGNNNISIAEYEMLIQKRIRLTTGREHSFDYTFFKMNMLDKTAISFGYYMKKTSTQYVNDLKMIFEID